MTPPRPNVPKDGVYPTQCISSARGDRWKNSGNVLDAQMALFSPTTSGPEADGELVQQRAPLWGALPGLRMAVELPAFAQALFDDAVEEHETCDSATFSDRVAFMLGESLRK